MQIITNDKTKITDLTSLILAISKASKKISINYNVNKSILDLNVP